MIDGLISGHLKGDPKSRTSSSGREFATALVRTSTRDGTTVFINVICFAPAAVAALIALQDGDSVALAGELTPKVYVPAEGEPRPSLDMVAHVVLSAYAVQRKRKATHHPQENDPPGSSSRSTGRDPELDDPIPF